MAQFPHLSSIWALGYTWCFSNFRVHQNHLRGAVLVKDDFQGLRSRRAGVRSKNLHFLWVLPMILREVRGPHFRKITSSQPLRALLLWTLSSCSYNASLGFFGHSRTVLTLPSVPACTCVSAAITLHWDCLSVGSLLRLLGARPRPWHRRGCDSRCWPDKGPAVAQAAVRWHGAWRGVAEVQVQGLVADIWLGYLGTCSDV